MTKYALTRRELAVIALVVLFPVCTVAAAGLGVTPGVVKSGVAALAPGSAQAPTSTVDPAQGSARLDVSKHAADASIGGSGGSKPSTTRAKGHVRLGFGRNGRHRSMPSSTQASGSTSNDASGTSGGTTTGAQGTSPAGGDGTSSGSGSSDTGSSAAASRRGSRTSSAPLVSVDSAGAGRSLGASAGENGVQTTQASSDSNGTDVGASAGDIATVDAGASADNGDCDNGAIGVSICASVDR
jgi:hypothetical protein